MTWKDSQSDLVLEDPEDPGYRRRAGGAAGWGVMGYAILGVGILVLSGVILYLFLGRSMSEDTEQIRMMANRLSALESRLASLEAAGRDDTADQRSKRMELFMGRFEKLEATLAQRMSDLTRRLETLEKGAVAVPPRKPMAAQQASPAVGGADHVVVKGDTLYSISRKYGLSVAELLSLNGLPDGAVIQPGQTLRVTAAP